MTSHSVTGQLFVRGVMLQYIFAGPSAWRVSANNSENT
jgi:hypothetical protein